MIRISKKADYAILAMGFLARRWLASLQVAPSGAAAGSGPAGEALATPAEGEVAPVPAQEIAEANELPRSVVANLLKDLARAELLESVRGIRGGYRLARHPDAISLADILATVDGPFQLVECAPDGDTSHEAALRTTDDADCRRSSCCPSRDPMRILHDRIVRLMRATSLTELSGNADEHAPGCAAIPSFDLPDDTLATSSRNRR